MKKTIINGFVCRVLHTKQKLKKNIQHLADQIFRDYKKREDIVLLIVMNGGMDFGMDLSRALEKRGLKHTRETITATRYTGDGKGTKKVEIFHKPNLSLAGKNVIVVEDLVDKGITLNKLHQYLKSKKPGSLNYAVLGVKKDHVFTGNIKYRLVKGFFPDLWLFGYGMDWSEYHRSTECILYNTQKIHKTKKFLNLLNKKT